MGRPTRGRKAKPEAAAEDEPFALKDQRPKPLQPGETVWIRAGKSRTLTRATVIRTKALLGRVEVIMRDEFGNSQTRNKRFVRPDDEKTRKQAIAERRRDMRRDKVNGRKAKGPTLTYDLTENRLNTPDEEAALCREIAAKMASRGKPELAMSFSAEAAHWDAVAAGTTLASSVAES